MTGGSGMGVGEPFVCLCSAAGVGEALLPGGAGHSEGQPARCPPTAPRPAGPQPVPV